MTLANRPKNILLVVFLIALAIVVGFFISGINRSPENKKIGIIGDANAATPVTVESYEKSVNGVLRGFSVTDHKAIGSVLEKLLALRVPASEKEVHLTLVSLFMSYDQAVTKKDGAAIAVALKDLHTFAEKNSWSGLAFTD